MKKFLKILSWAIGSVVAVVTVALVGIVLFVDPSDFKDDITQAVEDATGRDFELTGDIQLSVFPWLGVTLGAAQLGNAAGFDDGEFASVKSVDIKVKLVPLLSQRIEMKTVDLRGLTVNLSRKKDGRSNWNDLLAAPADGVSGGEKSLPSTAPPVTPTPENTTPTIAALQIGGINIENAKFYWDDQQAGQQVSVEQFSLRTGAIAPRTPIDIEISTQLKVSVPALQTPVKLQGQVTVDPQTQRYQFNVKELAVNVRGDDLPVSPMNAGLSAMIDADMAEQQVAVTGLQLQALGLDIKGTLNAAQLNTTPKLDGALNIVEFSPRDLAKTISLELPDTADKTMLNKVAIELAFSGSTDSLTVSQLDVRLDDSHLTGHAKVDHFDNPRVAFDIQLDEIDVDSYLPAEKLPAASTEINKPASSAPLAAEASAPLPLAMLRNLDVVGDVRVGKLKAVNARVSNVHIVMKAKGGQLRANPVKADLYGGTLDADVRMDVRKDTPRLTVREDLKKVSVGELLKDILGDDKVSGIATVSSNVSTTMPASGVDVAAMTKALNGSASFRFEDGAVKGVNLGQMIREAYAKIKKKPAPPKQENKTDFAEMSGSVKILDGVVSNDDLQAKSPLLRIAGKGKVDLPKERIQYGINASIVESDKGQAGKELAELKSLTIPIKIRGTFSKPKFSLDLGPVLKAKAKAEVKRQKKKLKKKAKKAVEKKKDKLKKRLEDSLKNKLKGLF